MWQAGASLKRRIEAIGVIDRLASCRASIVDGSTPDECDVVRVWAQGRKQPSLHVGDPINAVDVSSRDWHNEVRSEATVVVGSRTKAENGVDALRLCTLVE